MGTNILNIGEYIGIAPRSEFDLTRIIENGLPPESLALLKEHGLSFTEISEIVISPRTLKHRRARGENLSHDSGAVTPPRARKIAPCGHCAAKGVLDP